MSKRSKSLDSYAHEGKERPNNPQVGLVNHVLDPDEKIKSYVHDPHIDPELSWSGKQEFTSFSVPTVSLHVHERIDPRTISNVLKSERPENSQLSLFEHPEENPPLRKAIEFYSHKQNWFNRLIAGDSLLVMNSLLEKEELGNKVQTVYIDPPYGISYRSNFQPFVSNLDVSSGKDDDLTAEPEQIRAFRDTWELGIHSYLTYMRDRLLLSRELLTNSGSCFVQIGSENLFRLGMLMDEVFGADNRVTTITFATTSGSTSNTLPEVSDFLLWYAKDKTQMKYRQLYEQLNSRKEILEYFSSYAGVELSDGKTRKLTKEERLFPDENIPASARLYRRVSLDSQGISKTGRSEPFEWDGRKFTPIGHWGISHEGLQRLGELNRLDIPENQGSLSWKRYEDEVPGRRINNIWHSQMYATGKVYVVQTSTKAIERAILMTSDPGDLVLDPTCGSGTTAFVAEQWGRRWITCDTSRVAITIAKQRLMTSQFKYFNLLHPKEGVSSGFQLKSLKTVSAKILGYDEPPNETVLYDQPSVDNLKIRVTGPFTVEAVPAPTVESVEKISQSEQTSSADTPISGTGKTVRYDEWLDQLLNSGIRGKQGQKIKFSRLEPLAVSKFLHADGEASIVSIENDQPATDKSSSKKQNEKSNSDLDTSKTSERVVVSFGPDFAPLEQRQVEIALQEATTLVPPPKLIVFAAFQFDPEASKDIEETKFPGTTLLKTQMSADLLTGDLKKDTKNSETFWLIGQPDVQLTQIRTGKNKDHYKVSVLGFDYYNTITGKIESGSSDKIAMWLLDPDYNGRSLFPRQVFFPMAKDKEGWFKLAKSLNAEVALENVKHFHGSESIPFKPGKYERIAVKIIDDRGIESIKIMDVKNEE